MTTFATYWVSYQYTVMPFGLKNALAIFSRVVVAPFKDFIHKFLEVYLDDWNVFSLLKDHIEILRLMLDRCRQCHISLNLKKCIFCALFGILLGHVVCKQGLLVDLAKIAVILVYALQKFKHYLLGSRFNMYAGHSALKYLVNKPILGGRICRWLLLFQEYDFEVVVKTGKLNVGPYHLSCILSGEDVGNLDDSLPDAQLFSIKMVDDYFMEIM
jgi:hypothetical protein